MTELASMYFNINLDSTRPDEDAGYASIHCRSRAVSSYNVFMDKYRSIGSVWLAVSEFTNYAYEGRVDVTGTGTQLDVDLGGLDTSALVRTHALRLTALRRHIETKMSRTEMQVMDLAMRKAIDLLTLAEKLSRPFDPFERYWREMVLDDDFGGTSELVMRAASRFATLGPAVYLRYQNVQDILEGIDETLKFVSEMYCSLCSSSISKEHLYPTSSGSEESHESWTLSSENDVASLSSSFSTSPFMVESGSSSLLFQDQDDDVESIRPEITVRVLRGRSLYRQGKRDDSVNVYISVEVAGEIKTTDTAPTGSSDPVWDEGDTISELSFDGGDEGLDPHTVVRLYYIFEREERALQ